MKTSNQNFLSFSVKIFFPLSISKFLLASIATTIHCRPNNSINSVITLGFFIAPVLIPTLSAPLSKIFLASSNDLTPPPTVNGISITDATFLTKSLIVFRCSSDAVISKKTNSSAPSLLYFSANSTGSPASLMDSKCNPLTTLPFLTSKQGIILLVKVMIIFLPLQLKFYSHIVLFQELLQMHFFLLQL